MSAVNPALAELEFLAGEWVIELSNAAFLPSPTDKVQGRAVFEWIEGAAFLILRMYQGLSGPVSARWMIGRDETQANYVVLYYDSRTVSRIYRMSFEDGVWKMWRDAPGFALRFEGRVSDDGKTVTAHWEKSSDGLNWEHDFDEKFVKVEKSG